MELLLGTAVMLCILGCGMTCYFLGHRVGIEDAVQHLMDNGMLPDVEQD